MRSRYAAFALGLEDYLQKTLASDHPDRGSAHTGGGSALKFMGLRILFAEGDEVLFHARIFEKGRERSFAELSTFVREGAAWRYASGILVPHERLPKDLAALGRDAFLTLAASRDPGASAPPK